MSKKLIKTGTLRLSKTSPTQSSVFQIYKRLFCFGSNFWPVFVVAIIASMGYAAVDAGFTYLLKPLLDVGFIERDRTFLKWIPIILPSLFLVRAVFNFVSNYCMSWVGRSVVMKFRQTILHHYLHLPATFFDHNSSGQLLSMLTYNTSQVSNACTEAVNNSVQSSFLILGLIVVMFMISWQLSLIFLVTIPLTAIVVKLASRRLRRLNLRIQETMGHLAHVAEEVLESYKVVRIFGGERWEEKKFKKATEANAHQEMKVVVIKSLNVSMVQFIGIVALSLMVVMATSFQHVLSAGSFAAMFAAMVALLKPLKELTSINSVIQRGLAGAQSLFNLLDEPLENDHGELPLLRAKGDIIFRDVSFQYAEVDPDHARFKHKHSLHNINLNIQSGEIVAIVGRSGAGKTTLVNLLPRFYELNSGEIWLDGELLQNYRLTDLRRQFAVVSQSVTLFNGTIAQNIAYGSEHEQVSDDVIIHAAEAAHAMEFIQEFPNGIHTLIGENGVLLSGGQRQRLAIARAIVKNAPILILDEATSALDTEVERLIQDALETLMLNRTTIVIAHRLSTIENADKIIVMDNGRIKENGSHKNLLALNGFYAKLHRLQFAKSQVNHADEIDERV